MTDRPTTTTGKIKVNLSLDPDAVEMLEQLAPSRLAYGGVISELIREEARKRGLGDLSGRVARLELSLAELRATVQALVDAQKPSK